MIGGLGLENQFRETGPQKTRTKRIFDIRIRLCYARGVITEDYTLYCRKGRQNMNKRFVCMVSMIAAVCV